MSLMKEFRDFISRGNVVDMAVGVIVGGAFSTIVNSLVNDIIMIDCNWKDRLFQYVHRIER